MKVLFFLMFFLETQTFATSYRISHTLNNRYWSFSASTVSNQLQSSSDENDKLENTAIRLGVGKGFVRDNWSFSSEIELISGPLTPLFNRELEADFFGFGIKSFYNFTVFSPSLRGQSPSLNLTTGLGISSFEGSSIGTNLKLDSNYDSISNDGRKVSYEFSLVSLDFLVGTTLIWMEKARPEGNHPNILKTRLEGFSLSILAMIPLTSKYTSKTEFLTYNTGNNLTSRDTDNGRGSLEGLSLIVSIAALISD